MLKAHYQTIILAIIFIIADVLAIIAYAQSYEPLPHIHEYTQNQHSQSHSINSKYAEGH